MFKGLSCLVFLLFFSACFKKDDPSVRFDGHASSDKARGYIEIVKAEESEDYYALIYLFNSGPRPLFKNRMVDGVQCTTRSGGVYKLTLPSESFKYNEEILPNQWGQYFSVDLPVAVEDIQQFEYVVKDSKEETIKILYLRSSL